MPCRKPVPAKKRVNQPAPGVAALQDTAQALSEDLRTSGGAQSAQILQSLYGEKSSGVEAVPLVSGGGGSRAKPLPRAKTPGFGVDLSAVNTSVRPQDDFYRYVNGTWLKTYKLPADKSVFGAFHAIRDKAELEVKAIIENAASGRQARGGDAQRIAGLYKSYMDTDLLEKKGLQPLEAGLSKIARVKSKAELTGLFAQASRDGVETPVSVGVESDFKNPSANIAILWQSGLGLPDRKYYFDEDETAVKIRSKYVEYLTKLFTLSGEGQAQEKAAAVFALEKTLARRYWKPETNRNPKRIYNKIAVKDLKTMLPGFDWTGYLRAANIPATEREIMVGQPSYFQGFAKVLKEQPLETWKLYMKARTLDGAAPYLSDAFVKASFEYKGRTLQGQPEMQPRWKRGVKFTDGAVGELIGQAYVKEHYPASSKAKMAKLIENLRAAYGERIQGLAWMGAETKTKALDKLAKFNPKIGYPDKWRDYSKLTVRPDDLIGNMRRSNRVDYDYTLAKLGKPVDRQEWGMTPQTVNAYYNPTLNEIVFPAAILQGVFFNPDADDAVNYGAIGATIGHEMSHGFDDQGGNFDGDGVLKPWLSAKDLEEFKARAGKLVQQYNAYSPLPGKNVNGQLTLGENIADLGGVAVAYDAYRRSLKGTEAPVIGGFTGDQRFFMGLAQAERTLIRDELLEQRLNDPHAPSEHRVNGVLTNFPPFYKAFGVKQGDKLFRAEKDRVKLW